MESNDFGAGPHFDAQTLRAGGDCAIAADGMVVRWLKT
jgi:hypothetical protein